MSKYSSILLLTEIKTNLEVMGLAEIGLRTMIKWGGWFDRRPKEKPWFLLNMWKSYFGLLKITFTLPQNSGDE